MKSSSSRFLVLALILLSFFAALRSAARPRQSNVVPQNPAPKIDAAIEGEKRFRTNCGRCHHPPQDLSPREVRTVLQQMRIRAMLSAEDERLILKYLAP